LAKAHTTQQQHTHTHPNTHPREMSQPCYKTEMTLGRKQ